MAAGTETVRVGEAVAVGVVGLGLVGGSILRRLAEAGADYSLVGFDADRATCAAASRAGFTIAACASELARGSDLVVVAVPPERTAEIVIEVLRADPRTLVTDVASVKAPILDRVTAVAPDSLERFLPGHPLAGAEARGWESARPDLLAHTIWAVCPPSPAAPAELLCRWSPVLEAFQARLVVCGPSEHDLAVARTSHAPHIAAEVIAGSLRRDPTRLAAVLSGGGFRDLTRIARSSRALWEQILDLNRDAVAAVIDEWLVDLRRLRAAVVDAEPGLIGEAWETGERMLDLVDELRWASPEWERESFAWPAWEQLLELGRAGRSLRSVRWEDGRVAVEVSRPPDAHQVG